MPTQTTISPRAGIDLGLLTLLWGASFLAIRIALDELTPLTAVAHRVGWAALALWALVLIRRLPLPRDPATWAAFLVMGLLNNAIPFSLMAWGQLHIESGLTAILNATTAVFGLAVAALVFPDERLTPRRAIGVGLGLLGVATTIGLDRLLSFDLRAVAQLAVLAGALSYAFAAAFARARFGHLRPEVAAMGMLTGSALVMVPVAWVADGPFTLKLEPQTMAAIAFFALLSTAGAYLLYYRIIAAAGAANTMLVTLTIPPVAIGLGALIRHEALPLQAYPGFALIAVGLVVMNRRPSGKRWLSQRAEPR